MVKTKTWLILLGVLFGVGLIAGFLISIGVQGGKNSASSIKQAQTMAELTDTLGGTLAEFRSYRDRTTERIDILQSNNLQAGSIITELRGDNAELAIRYRELEARFGELAGQLPDVADDISGVAGDIGDLIEEAEAGESDEGG